MVNVTSENVYTKWLWKNEPALLNFTLPVFAVDSAHTVLSQDFYTLVCQSGDGKLLPSCFAVKDGHFHLWAS